MKSQWSDQEAQKYSRNPLDMRVYTSRLLGREPDLVLHGGGNTSVKSEVTNLFGEKERVLYVKGSGWDLATIESAGFAAVRMDTLHKLVRLHCLSDQEMVLAQKSAMLDPAAPTPSVEAILHAIIPFDYVDHTHADAVVTLTNTPQGQELIRNLYGQQVLVLPYVMPGFVLAKYVYEATLNLDWSKIEGIILLHHGVFTFADHPRKSYENMLKLVTQAEDYLAENSDKIQSLQLAREVTDTPPEYLQLAKLRQTISRVQGKAHLAILDRSPESKAFAAHPEVANISRRGPLTPDHVIRTKRNPVIINHDVEYSVENYVNEYRAYFQRHAREELTCLSPAPCWAIWPGQGRVSFGRTIGDARIIEDIAQHTIKAIVQAERLGGWTALPEKDIFDIEYWELEQAKLKKRKLDPSLQGKIALVTGAAQGIGYASVQALVQAGAAVAAIDVSAQIVGRFAIPSVSELRCDVTESKQLQQSIEATVEKFGGLDILVCNAGVFPPSENLEDMKSETWARSMAVNLTSHQQLIRAAIPYLKLGIDPCVIIIASRNVTAPGPGAAAYSVAKAGLTQLGRVAALELGPVGIRVNMLHPDAVFDTGIWTPPMLENRAKQYGMTIEEYKTRNLLKAEITSKDVASLVCALAGPVFYKTTGAQIPIDGGNDRVI